ncbi:pyridoxamine 5'-phosphate oxidase family protein [Myxococcus sp. AB025B]|uniref:pyridoxamine 5'-phosphate oxidase family protein n=1 Tax=Myxococcus sp. AB025B TaxID=2562794 RepID=UPI001142FB71|nr:pyridoxamine 5'-phosphate oxidase family protein [Myxococcus sp. AB025B]
MATLHRPLLQRLELLLRTGRFVTLATSAPSGAAWASTVNYVPHISDQVRLIWYSMKDARHSRNIERQEQVSGSIFRTDLETLSPLGLDGVQLVGRCHAVEGQELESYRDYYYRRNFPDDTVRQKWLLPPEEFTDKGPRRFYALTIEEWWLLDIDGWLEHMRDQRIDLPPPSRVVTLAAQKEFEV